jgi:hypothetical protein
MLTYLSIAQYRAVLAAEGGSIGSMHPSESAAAAGASAAVLSDFFPLDVATIEGWLADDRTNQQLQWPGEQNKDVGAGEAIGRAVAAGVTHHDHRALADVRWSALPNSTSRRDRRSDAEP